MFENGGKASPCSAEEPSAHFLVNNLLRTLCMCIVVDHERYPTLTTLLADNFDPLVGRQYFLINFTEKEQNKTNKKKK